ncbi:PAP2 superfamily protein [Arcticibacter tournemirensis]|uniref:Phosphatase PAP2 family protein n=1 Tax=Arcticibacter tournemirensis TaxID=699437 RepID=A0A5M9HGN9_9SPHI|nr:phosphatase PAP2 family protein [Arcticibacter tournemirensis]KAA8485565.1 phosphatase PAP2 family protein [Arcticibacter tournemirensis]TQM48720.1 PAP2 superfamily protein [Arcticibacter tournemirensis]
MKAINILFSRSFFSQGFGLFFLLMALIWLQLIILLICYGNSQSTILLNSFHISWLDHPLFWVAQGSCSYIVTSGVVIALARRAPAYSLTAILASLFSWYACITIQYNHFQHWKAPVTSVLANSAVQPELNFPSVQAAVVTCLAIYLSWCFTESFKYAFIFWLVALLLMYSRIYLGWAYVSDVLAGNVLGTIMAICCILWLPERLERWYERRSKWWQDMIIAIMRTAAICTVFVNLKYFIL